MKLLYCAIGAGRGFALIAFLSFGISNGYSQSDDPCQLAMDVDSDGIIGITDLLGLLAYFGNSDLDFDCIWDNIDPCVNGEGDCAEEMSGPCDGLAFVEYNGYDYSLVEVGDDCWFAENLRTEVYANGDSIARLEDLGEEHTNQYPNHRALYIHSYGDGFFDLFGYLYSGFAILDDRNLCPGGFHPSQNSDWYRLESFLGHEENEIRTWGNSREVYSDDVKSTCGWDLGFWGTNHSNGDPWGLGFGPSAWAWNYSNPEYGNNAIGSFSYWSSASIAWSRLLNQDPTWNNTQWTEGGKRVTEDGFPYALMGENESDTLFISSQASRVLISDNPHIQLQSVHPNLASAVRCVKNQGAAGETCDDGNDFTFNDTWQDSGFCEGTWSIDIQGGGPCEGEAFLEYDSNQYTLVELDGRCWFQENLQTQIYSNGDSITFLIEWNNPDSAAMTQASHDLALYPDEYFYNLYVGQDPRGVCPSGWSVPTTDEWQSLKDSFGGNESFVANNLLEPGWDFSFVPAGSNNSGGFSVLQTGHIYPQSSTMHAPNFSGFLNANTWSYCTGFPFCLPSMSDPNAGLSIRCIKDL
ncbi:fibrobacter succinogenes major paralogous domain-containing protein [Flavobacteriales bacterium]|nr:fibrobacter succinogenes major paralogous domain-containing protein [Flavobacteriales bacterium]